jgi:hypothetical protein
VGGYRIRNPDMNIDLIVARPDIFLYIESSEVINNRSLEQLS